MQGNTHTADPGGGGAPKLRLLIASDVRFVRESMGEILGRREDMSVIGYCASSSRILSICQELQPSMVLLDAATRGGLLTVRPLREMSAKLLVVVFALAESSETVLDWAEAGVSGYIPSTAAAVDLSIMVADISTGKQACSALVAASLLRRIATGAAVFQNIRTTPPQTLTPREFEVVGLVSTGLSNKEIARELDISLATTKSHVHNAFGKLRVQRRGQAATWMHARTSLA